MAKKTIFFDSFCSYTVAAVTESGKLTEFKIEKPSGGIAVGNIYKGRIENVLPGMQAAFVNCGLERNCYVSADDIFPDSVKYETEADGVPSVVPLREGDEILVQVTKLPVGKKGARVTTHPSFVGKTIIYMPETPFVGCSRKISDAELKNNLLYSAKKYKKEGEGLIVRTAAPYAKLDQKLIELHYMRNLYSEIKKAFKSAEVGALLYTDVSLPMRIMRDTLTYDIDSIIVGNAHIARLLDSLFELYPADSRRPVILHDSGKDMFGEYGISQQINAMCSPRAEMENGAYLVIEKTEALTVIDVNTGKFTGDDNLEQTVYRTNILAAREIARQVKLRNIGGIVVVDFIDMTDPAHNSALVAELERALKRDSAKCSVAPMSGFGLVEFTRKRTGSSPLSFMLKPCRNCGYTGYAKSAEFILMSARAEIFNLYADGARSVRADMSRDIFSRFSEWRAFKEDILSHCPNLSLYAVPHGSYRDEQLTFRVCTDVPYDATKLI